MTKEQAILYFPHASEDDLEEVWEQRFFEQKQFFLTRPPLRKVWEARLKKLTKQFNAYLVLSDQSKVENKIENKIEKPVFSNDFIVSFHEFHALRNQHKSTLLQTRDLTDFVNAVENWLNAEHCFALHWTYPKSEHNEIEVMRSKEPDPMEFLKDLNRTEKLISSSSLITLKENYNNLSESVKKEVKRLTLLANE